MEWILGIFIAALIDVIKIYVDAIIVWIVFVTILLMSIYILDKGDNNNE